MFPRINCFSINNTGPRLKMSMAIPVGFRGLVVRTKARDQQDTIKMAEKVETKTMFHLYRLAMGLTTLQRKHMCDLYKSMDEEQGMG